MSERALAGEAELENLAKFYSIASGFEELQALFDYETIRRNLGGPDVLELGCADGAMTRWLTSDGFRVCAVDGSSDYTARTQRSLEEAGADPQRWKVVTSLFENLELDERFDDITMSNILHHPPDPVSILQRAAGWLKQGGRLHVVVPNAHSLHRRIGLQMGVIDDLHELSTENVRMSHRRVFDRWTTEQALRQGGWSVSHFEGIFLKPLARGQLAELPTEALRALNEVGKSFPELCHHLYFLCHRAEEAS